MPLYADPVYQSLNNAFARDASKMNKEITDIQITKSDIVWGVSFALVSGIITYIMGGMVFFLIFQSVNSIEHEKLNEKIISFMIKVLKKDSKINWKEKMKKAIWKIRGLTIFRKLLIDIRNGIKTKKEDDKTEDQEQIDSLINSDEFNESIKNDVNISDLKNNMPKNTNFSNRSDLSLMIDPMNNLDLVHSKKNSFDIKVEINNNNIVLNDIVENAIQICSSDTFEYVSPIGLTTGSNRSIFILKIAKFYSYVVSERKFMYPSLVELKEKEKIECVSVEINEKKYFTFQEEIVSTVLYYVRILIIIICK